MAQRELLADHIIPLHITSDPKVYRSGQSKKIIYPKHSHLSLPLHSLTSPESRSHSPKHSDFPHAFVSDWLTWQGGLLFQGGSYVKGGSYIIQLNEQARPKIQHGTPSRKRGGDICDVAKKKMGCFRNPLLNLPPPRGVSDRCC